MCPRRRSEWNACIFSGWDPGPSRCIVIDIIAVTIVRQVERIRQRRLVISETAKKAIVTCGVQDKYMVETLHSPLNRKTDFQSMSRLDWKRTRPVDIMCGGQYVVTSTK